MKMGGQLRGALLVTREPRDAETYYQWLLGLEPIESPHQSLESIGVVRVLEPGKEVESPAGWVPIFAVDDIENSAQRARSMGVTLRPDPIADTGVRVVANSSGIWTGLVMGQVSAEAHVSNPGLNCDYCALEVRVATATLKALLGSKSLEILDDLYGMNVLYEGDSFTCGVLQMSGIEALSTRPYWVTYFEVSDIGQTTMRAVESGSRIVIPPAKSPFNQYAVFRDPWGNIFGLSQLDAEPTEKKIPARLSNGDVVNLGDVLKIRL